MGLPVGAVVGVAVEVEDATVTEPESPSLWRRVRANSFGPASEEPYRRRFSDWIRVGVGVALLGCARRAPG
jgi:hypothetical protein